MPNVAVVLKEEIRRVARKEIRAATESLKKENTRLRKALSDLKKKVTDLERQQKQTARTSGTGPAASAIKAETNRNWVTAKGIRSMRKKMQVTQSELAQLLGVSAQSVTTWERKDGKLNLRNNTSNAIAQLRGIGAREARARLQTLNA